MLSRRAPCPRHEEGGHGARWESTYMKTAADAPAEAPWDVVCVMGLKVFVPGRDARFGIII